MVEESIIPPDEKDPERIERHNYYLNKYKSELSKEILLVTSLKARKTLLLVSSLAILVVKLNLLPTQIGSFGIDLTSVDQNNMIIALSLLLIYFCINFILYTISDVRHWQSSVLDIEHSLQEDRAKLKINDIYVPATKFYTEPYVFEFSELSISNLFRYIKIMPLYSLLRNFFDLLFPILLALYATYSLLMFEIIKHK